MRGGLPLAVGFALAVLLQMTIGPVAGPFAVKLLMDIGINVILAVSLNLVNGFTGQFSIGHAGFMAVGGYVAGAVTYYGSFLIWGGPQVQLVQPSIDVRQHLLQVAPLPLLRRTERRSIQRCAG